jgi:hydrogenase maturation protease
MLETHIGPSPDVEFLDLGTAGFELLHAMTQRQSVVILDCAFMGTPPGTLRRFAPEEVRSVNLAAGEAGHQSDVLHIIGLLKRLEHCPRNVVIYGVEPETVAPGEQLSETLEKKLPEYVQTVSDHLRTVSPHA